MILHGFAWRSSKNMLLLPKTLIFDGKLQRYFKNPTNTKKTKKTKTQSMNIQVFLGFPVDLWRPVEPCEALWSPVRALWSLHQSLMTLRHGLLSMPCLPMQEDTHNISSGYHKILTFHMQIDIGNLRKTTGNLIPPALWAEVV